jgi:hypothetical protein
MWVYALPSELRMNPEGFETSTQHPH